MKMVDIPPVWLALAAGLAWAQTKVLPGPAVPGWIGTAGTLLVLLGVLIAALAAIEFPRHRTSIIPHQNPKALVARGIYRLSRNPIYLGDVLILLGLILRWGALWSLPLVPLFALLIDLRFIRSEEARLRAAFGEAFESYARQTRRWL